MRITWKPYDGSVNWTEDNLGGLGGFFNMHVGGQRWHDYISRWPVISRPYIEALRAHIVANRIRRGGFWHQDSSVSGVPHFDDGTCFQASMRGWGDLLAAVWSQEDGRDYCYTYFAWDESDCEVTA